MASIKMTKTAAGPQGTWGIGQTYHVPEQVPLALAREYVKRHAAVWVEKPSIVERATAKRRGVENTDARPKEE